MIDVARVRRDTPGCAECIHFNNAGASLMPQDVLDVVIEHLELESRIGGYEAADSARTRIEAVYDSAASLINCSAAEIALLENATRAWAAVFYAVPFDHGDRIVTGRAEYCSNYMAFLHVQRRTGAEIVVVGDDSDGQIDLDELSAVLRRGARLVALTHVPTSGGLVNPAAEVGVLAREFGVWYLLDACQSVGQMPVDVRQIGCDFLSTTGRKFLRGPRGTGFLFVRRDLIQALHPAAVEVGSAAWVARSEYRLKEDARRFETWEASHALQLGLGRAIDYAMEIEIPAIWSRVRELATELRGRLAAIDGVVVRDMGATKCAIVTFSTETPSAAELAAALRGQAIHVDTSSAEDTRLDFEARNLKELVRASVHYFNTSQEIARFCDVVKELAATPVRRYED